VLSGEVGLRERRSYEERCDAEVLTAWKRRPGSAEYEAPACQRRLLTPNSSVGGLTQCDQGMNDEIFPIEDSMIPLHHGSVKDARYIPNSMHMGEPAAGPIIFKWIEAILRKWECGHYACAVAGVFCVWNGGYRLAIKRVPLFVWYLSPFGAQ